MATKAVAASDKSQARFIGFYLSLKDRQAELDHLVCQFSTQLLKGLKLYNNCKVIIDRQETTLTESLMTLDRKPPPSAHVKDMPVEFILFRGDYIKAFQDGFAMFNILQRVATDDETAIKSLKAQYEKYKKDGKTNPYLRACYCFMSNNFVTKLPSEYHIAFSVDCLLYGEWRCDHPNLVGLHLLALAWMLGVSQFSRFLHPGMLTCSPISTPMLGSVLENKGIQLSITEPQLATAANAKAAAPGPQKKPQEKAAKK